MIKKYSSLCELRVSVVHTALVAALPRCDLRGERNQGDSPKLRHDTSTVERHG